LSAFGGLGQKTFLSWILVFGGKNAAFLSAFSSFWQGGIFYGILLAKL
jgi:hypothetical protein